MKPLNEMKRILRMYGKRIKLCSGNKSADGSGLFCRIYTSSPEQQRPQQTALGRSDDKNYSLWAYCASEIEQVDHIESNGKTYPILSGGYDSEAGCWRWIVKEEQI